MPRSRASLARSMASIDRAEVSGSQWACRSMTPDRSCAMAAAASRENEAKTFLMRNILRRIRSVAGPPSTSAGDGQPATSIITIYGSGFGHTTPEGVDGRLAAAPLPKPVLPVSATLGSLPATVLYAGDASGLVEGIVQLNIQLPKTFYYGELYVSVGDNAMGFNINVR